VKIFKKVFDFSDAGKADCVQNLNAEKMSVMNINSKRDESNDYSYAK
jgi:hypothetical protein